MTFRLSSWIFSRSPRLLLVVLASLWIVQMTFWAIWEWRREPVLVTTMPQDPVSTQSVLSVEAPLSNEPLLAIPESPFLSRNPDVLSRYFDYSDERSNALSAYPDSKSQDSSLASDSSSPLDLALPVSTETNAVDFAKTLRYRGFLKTPKEVRIAFIEDVESAFTHRLRVGERFKNWTIQSIERGQVVFTSDKEENSIVLRQISETLDASKESTAAPEEGTVASEESTAALEESGVDLALVATPVEAEPQHETNSVLAQEAPQP